MTDSCPDLDRNPPPFHGGGPDDGEEDLRGGHRNHHGFSFGPGGFRDHGGGDEEDPRRRSDGDDAFGIHVDVFTNPLEMEKFFDRQLDQMLRGFGMIGPGFGFGGNGGVQQLPPPPPGLYPEDRRDEEPPAGSREFMLKDGGGDDSKKKLFGAFSEERREDSDVDERVKSEGLDGLFGGQRRGDALEVPDRRGGFFFGGGFPGFPGFPGFGYPEQYGHPVRHELTVKTDNSPNLTFFSVETRRPRR